MNVERTLVISDIHGCYREFIELLEKVDYRSVRDRLILLGDYVSRGPESKEVVDLVMHLVQEQGAIALQGNHDHRFVRVVENRASEKEIITFFEKGGSETLQSYCKTTKSNGLDHLKEVRDVIMGELSSHMDFLKNLPCYYEDNDYIYVHAGLNPLVSQLSEQNVHDLLYIKEEFYRNKTRMEKVVVFGHTVTKDIHGSCEIWLGGDKIGIDGGCSFGGQLNCLELVHGKVGRFYVNHSKCTEA
ncbi:metallophosphoesterase family protein [Paenibacillus algorifonticola]|uniref:metallophosphoesterase family protein n=1 Tax=Paenibacillus algorifonticola TaxID=684063 RepID=UPI003D2D4457